MIFTETELPKANFSCSFQRLNPTKQYSCHDANNSHTLELVHSAARRHGRVCVGGLLRKQMYSMKLIQRDPLGHCSGYSLLLTPLITRILALRTIFGGFIAWLGEAIDLAAAAWMVDGDGF